MRRFCNKKILALVELERRVSWTHQEINGLVGGVRLSAKMLQQPGTDAVPARRADDGDIDEVDGLGAAFDQEPADRFAVEKDDR